MGSMEQMLGNVVLRGADMSAARKRGLARLMLRWPERRAIWLRKAGEDDQFGELCEAYEAACSALEFWSRSDAPIPAARIAEYRALVSETEADIFEMIC